MKRHGVSNDHNRKHGKRQKTDHTPPPYAALREVLSTSKRLRNYTPLQGYAASRRVVKDRLAPPPERPRVVPASERNDIALTAATGATSHRYHHQIAKHGALRSAQSIAADYVDTGTILGIDQSEEMRELLRTAGLLDDAESASQLHPVAKPSLWPLNVDLGQNRTAKAVRAEYLSLQPLNGLWKTQEEGVDFLRAREQSKSGGFAGGLIADEMGLGKTVQFLCHVLRDNQELCQRTGRPYGHPTLVVMEKGLVDTWRRQLADHFAKQAFVVAYLCHENTGSPPVPENITPTVINQRYTLAITTYPVLRAAYASLVNASKNPASRLAPFTKALYETTWTRVLAEEAHVVSNATSLGYHALCALQSRFRWVQTGTPVVNDAGSVCSLLNFVGGPDVKEKLSIDFSARQQRVSGTAAAARIEMHRDEHEFVSLQYLLKIRDILQTVMIRRHQMLRPVCSTVALVDFETRAERDVYGHYYRLFGEHCRASLNAHKRPRVTYGHDEDEEHEKKNQEDEEDDEEERGDKDADGDIDVPSKTKLQQVSVDILRLRQLCAAPIVITNLSLPDHILLDRGFSEQQRANANTQQRILGSSSVSSLTYLCAARLLLERDPIETAFLEHQDGLPPNFIDDDLDWLRRIRPQCNRLFTSSGTARLREVLRHIRARILPSIGTKVRMMVRRYCHVKDHRDKFIIFSDWVRVLEHIESVFKRIGLGSVMITGKQSTGERNKTLSDFAAHDHIQGLLGSLQVVANGLNIECANHVTVVGPWWNPHVTQQGECRIRRPGQLKTCYSYNIVIRGTVEEDVRRMASEKELIARILLENDAETEQLIQDMLTEGSAGKRPVTDVSKHYVLQELMQSALARSV